MVLMNYHELTMNEDRSSSARRLQFILICGVMGAAILYSSLTSGVLTSLDIQPGSFPGGEFVYKTTKRDYAASGSLERNIAEAVGDGLRHNTVDQVFSVFLDHPAKITDGRRLRFASGYLVGNPKSQLDGPKTHKRLMELNSKITSPTKTEILELPAEELWRKLKFKETKLPKVKAGVINFPFTNGFVSCLVFSMRILPAMHKYAKAQGYVPTVVISTCSEKEHMCTHYVPLIDEKNSKTTPYLLGQPAMDEYIASLPPPRPLISFEDISRKLGLSPMGQYLGFGKNRDAMPDKEEL